MTKLFAEELVAFLSLVPGNYVFSSGFRDRPERIDRTNLVCGPPIRISLRRVGDLAPQGFKTGQQRIEERRVSGFALNVASRPLDLYDAP